MRIPATPAIQNSAAAQRVVTGTLRRVRRGRAKVFVAEAPAEPSVRVRRPARVAVMLALAHEIQAAIDGGSFVTGPRSPGSLGFRVRA